MFYDFNISFTQIWNTDIPPPIYTFPTICTKLFPTFTPSNCAMQTTYIRTKLQSLSLDMCYTTTRLPLLSNQVLLTFFSPPPPPQTPWFGCSIVQPAPPHHHPLQHLPQFPNHTLQYGLNLVILTSFFLGFSKSWYILALVMATLDISYAWKSCESVIFICNYYEPFKENFPEIRTTYHSVSTHPFSIIELLGYPTIDFTPKTSPSS